MRIPISYNMQVRNLFGVLIYIYIWIYWINTDFNITSCLCSLFVLCLFGVNWVMLSGSWQPAHIRRILLWHGSSELRGRLWILNRIIGVHHLYSSLPFYPVHIMLAISSLINMSFLITFTNVILGFPLPFCPFNLNQIIIFHWRINCSHLYMTNAILWLPLSFSWLILFLLCILLADIRYVCWTQLMLIVYLGPHWLCSMLSDSFGSYCCRLWHLIWF